MAIRMAAERKSTKNKTVLPIVHPTYEKTVELSRKLRVHADGRFPDTLLGKAHPNETDPEFKYRIDNYQAVTQPAWANSLKTVNRIWNKSNYTVQWPKVDEDNKDAPQTYFEQIYPTYQSIYKYFSSIVTDLTFKDPNAIMVGRPRVIPEKLDKDGNLEADQNQLIEPIAIIFSSKQVMRFEENVFVLVLTARTSRLDDDDVGVKTGLIFEFYDDEVIWTITQIGKKKKPVFTIEKLYRHNLGVLPAWQLPGIDKQFKEFAFKASFFQPAVPNLNEAVIDNSNLFMAKTSQAFPQKWELTQPCNNEDCRNGFIDTDGDGGRVECPTCHGTQQISSPLGVHQIPVPAEQTDSTIFSSIPTPPAGFISPNPAILEFLRKEIEANIVMAFAFVGIDISNTQVKGSDTALGKMIDREETFAFLLRVAGDMFPLMQSVINTLGRMRYVKVFEPPVITPPVTFKIRTEAELIEEITAAKKAGVNETTIKELNKQLAEQRFNTTVDSTQKIQLIYRADSLTVKTDLEINADLTLNKINKWQAILHDNIEIYIAEELDDNAKFFENKIEDQVAALEAKAQEQAATTAQNNGTTEGVLSSANAQ